MCLEVCVSKTVGSKTICRLCSLKKYLIILLESKKNKHFVIKTMCCKQLICENYLFAIPQTSFLVGTFFAATYSKDGSNVFITS